MVYWFKNLKNDSPFPIEDESSAWKLLKTPDFSRKFVYIGRSDGKEYQRVIQESGLKKMNAKEHAEVVSSGVQDEARGDVARSAFAAELKVALEKGDKTLPRDFQYVDTDNRPISDPSMIGFLRMMR